MDLFSRLETERFTRVDEDVCPCRQQFVVGWEQASVVSRGGDYDGGLPRELLGEVVVRDEYVPAPGHRQTATARPEDGTADVACVEDLVGVLETQDHGVAAVAARRGLDHRGPRLVCRRGIAACVVVEEFSNKGDGGVGDGDRHRSSPVLWFTILMPLLNGALS